MTDIRSELKNFNFLTILLDQTVEITFSNERFFYDDLKYFSGNLIVSGILKDCSSKEFLLNFCTSADTIMRQFVAHYYDGQFKSVEVAIVLVRFGKNTFLICPTFFERNRFEHSRICGCITSNQNPAFFMQERMRLAQERHLFARLKAENARNLAITKQYLAEIKNS